MIPFSQRSRYHERKKSRFRLSVTCPRQTVCAFWSRHVFTNDASERYAESLRHLRIIGTTYERKFEQHDPKLPSFG